MRLIDADALKNELYKLGMFKDDAEMVNTTINCMPTAYDPNRVIEEIELRKGISRKNIVLNSQEEQWKHRWIPVSERLPEDTVNPITRNAYVYPVTVDLGGVTDTRYYSFCRGHWYNQGPKKMDDLVIAWKERPEPYRPE